jgi:multiple sugar transport system substrate-binding protein
MVVPWSLAVSAQSDKKDAALEFLKWATSKQMAKIAQLNGLTMARTSVWNDQEVLKKLYPGLAECAKITGSIAVPYDRPLMTAVGEARDAIGEVIVKAIETGGKADIPSLAKTAAEKVDKLLVKAGEGPKQ